MAAPHSVICAGLGFDWPDGRTVLDGLDLAFGAARSGLVGRNGSGKTTLLRLLAGELSPTRGRVSAPGDVGYLPQALPLDTARTVADVLGISARRDALHAIEAGSTQVEHFTVLDDDWEVEARALAALDRFAILPGAPDRLDRPVGTLSGGEAVLTGLAGLIVHAPAVSLLDEPTNNLDARARGLVHDAVAGWSGVLIVVSHDRELLERVDAIVELRAGAARTFGGPYSAYAATLEAEAQTAARLVRAAEGDLAREKRQVVQTQTKLAHRERTARRAEREKRVPGVVAGLRRQQAQVSAGRYRAVQTDRRQAASTALAEAESAVRDDDHIRVELPGTAVPAGRTVLQVGELVVRGPERIALSGPNGSGKTTLLDAVAGRRAHPAARVAAPRVPTAYLPQRLDVLDDAQTVLDNVRAGAPAADPQQVRAQLARFLVRGDAVDQPAGTLSGGERFRVTLARLLLADPPPQLLLLDEPTNNLDLDSVAQLTEALRAYRGALLVASHDRNFLDDVGVTRTWTVAEVGLPRDDLGSRPR